MICMSDFFASISAKPSRLHGNNKYVLMPTQSYIILQEKNIICGQQMSYFASTWPTLFKLKNHPGAFRSIDRTPLQQLMCRICNPTTIQYHSFIHSLIHSFIHLFIHGSFYKSFQHLALHSVA